jgi:hypothetical protein
MKLSIRSHLVSSPNRVHTAQQGCSMPIYILRVKSGAGIVSVRPNPSIALLQLRLEVRRQEIAKPDTVCLGVLPCFCGVAV